MSNICNYTPITVLSPREINDRFRVIHKELCYLASATSSGGFSTASNGLTPVGTDVQLGGQLSAATTIDVNSKSLSFTNGPVGIGTTSTPLGSQLHLNNGGAFSASLPTLGPLTITGTNLAYITLIGANNTANAECGIIAMRARGTLAAPAAVQSGDFLAAFIAAAYDGGSRQTPGALEFYAEAGTSGPVIPTRACLSTGTYGGDRLPHLAVDYQGHVGIGNNMTTQAITGWLHLPASDGTAGRGPLKFTAGTNLATPENGVMEFDGTHLYITIAGVRTTIV